jgi:ribosome-associated translation inhibitor RaiA
MKVYNPSIEERAFLYQEAQDLAPLVKDIGSLSVLVEEQAQSGFRVTFLVAPESMGLQIHAENDNLFAATIAAKEEAQRQLNTLINALNGVQADAHILH